MTEPAAAGVDVAEMARRQGGFRCGARPYTTLAVETGNALAVLRHRMDAAIDPVQDKALRADD